MRRVGLEQRKLASSGKRMGDLDCHRCCRKRTNELFAYDRQHGVRPLDICLAAGMRSRHIYRAAALGHLLAALAFSFGHFLCRNDAGHRGISRHHRQKQDACELVDESHVDCIVQGQQTSLAVTRVTSE
jgi:hypothetical protein